MNCSPLLYPPPTRIPAVIRDWLGARLQGPPGGPRLRRPRACLFAVGRIGDFVLALSALRLLVQEFGTPHCVLVIPADVAAIVAREFPGVRCIMLPAEAGSLVRGIVPAWWRERPRFAADHFDQLICLNHQRSLYNEVALSWIDAEKDMRLGPETYPREAREGWCTELLAHRRLVESVLGRGVSPEDILPAFTGVPTGDDGRLLVYPLSRDPLRCLPVERIARILQLWRGRSRAPVVFSGGPADSARLGPYVAAVRESGLDGVSVELPSSVGVLLDQVARAGAVLSTETAAAHIATALDKRTVVMAGGGHPGFCYPWRRSARQQPVQNPLPCFRCGWRCTQPEMFCLTQLPVETAAAALPAL